MAVSRSDSAMRPNHFPPRDQSGFSMIEVMVSLAIIMLGLMGIAGMLAKMQQSEFESYQRAQAVVLLQDMVDRITVHHLTASCFQFTNAATGAPFLGTDSTYVSACSASTAGDNAQADASINEWSNLLKGAAET